MSTIYSEKQELLSQRLLFQGPLKYLPFKKSLVTIIIGMTIHGFGLGASVVGGKHGLDWNKVMIICPGFSDAHKSAIKCGFPDTIDTYGLVSGLWTSVFAFGAFVGEFLQVRMVLGRSHQDGITSFIVIRASGDWRCYPTHSIMFQDRPSEEFCMMQSPSAGPSSLSSSESSSPSSGSSGWRQSF